MKIAAERKDVGGPGVAPKDVRQCLAEVGGLNPFGEPNYRLTIAEHTRWFQGGVWRTYRNGASLRDRGSFMEMENGMRVERVPEKPISERAEMRWVNRYPPDLAGWIFQEWFPAHHYGNREDWEAMKVPGHSTLCRLGPYPEKGDYELALPFGYGQGHQDQLTLPPLHVLKVAVCYAERCRENWNRLTPAARIRMREDSMLQARALAEMKRHDDEKLRMRDIMSPLLSTTLEAGRWREQLVKDAGLKIGHVGN